jgi:hypothetical protein
MEKAMTILLYATAIVMGGLLYYFFARHPAADDLRAEQSAARDRKAYRRAIGRWENEGGATPAGHDHSPPHARSS